MGLRERLARANWELNVFLRTGRLPRYAPQAFGNPNPQWRQPRQPQSHPRGQPALTLCRFCKNYVPANANYCDKCGTKLR